LRTTAEGMKKGNTSGVSISFEGFQRLVVGIEISTNHTPCAHLGKIIREFFMRN
jgi:hypothetical protein